MPIFNNALAGAAGSAGGADADFKIERSLRFNSADSAYLSRTPSTAGSGTTWTVSGWVKRTEFGSYTPILISADTAQTTEVAFTTDNKIQVADGSTTYRKTNADFRDPSAFYHIVVTWDSGNSTVANRCRIYVNGTEQSYSTNTTITQHATTDINTTDIHYIGRQSNTYTNCYQAEIHFIDGTALAPTAFGEFDATTGVWNPIKYTGTYGTNGFHLDFSDPSDLGNDAAGSNNFTPHNLVGTAGTEWSSYGDSNSYWADTVFDSSATETTFGGGTTMTWNANSHATGITWNNSLKIRYLRNTNGGPFAFNGTNLTLSDTGHLNWATVDISSQVTSPLTTISLTRSSSGSSESGLVAIYADDVLIKDVFASDIDSLIDSPMNYAADSGNNGGNYPTFNPLSEQYSSANHVLEDGNLQHGDGSSDKGNYSLDISTMAAPPSGKWYWEMTTRGNGSYERRMIGVMASDANFAQYIPHDNSTDGLVGIWLLTGEKIVNGSKSSYTSSFREGNTVGVALDQDNQAVNFYLNGSAQGSISLPTNMQGKSIVAAVSSIYVQEKILANFGQRPFKHTPPTGYKSLCTQNLPDPDIAKGSDYFEAKPYDGTGNTLNVTGLDFEPDLVYTATHNAAGYIKYIWDDVRGATKALATSHTQGDDAEVTVSNGLTSFNSDGFTVGNNGQVNESSSRKMIAWCWAGGSAFSNSANTNGATIASSGLANTTSGISIVSYQGNNTSGATVKHGLNAEVEFAILKTRDQDGQLWHVYHSALAANEYIYLNTAGAKTSGNDFMNGTRPSSSVFTLGNGQACNKLNDNVIGYFFNSVEGYSAFGKYSGNGSEDGPFVYTGFRPRWIMTKAYSANSNNNNNWIIIDTARDPINEADKALNPNTNAATLENSHTGIDILSNGFRLKGDSNGQSNYNGWDYLYAAFAEHPFKYARAR